MRYLLKRQEEDLSAKDTFEAYPSRLTVDINLSLLSIDQDCSECAFVCFLGDDSFTIQ